MDVKNLQSGKEYSYTGSDVVTRVRYSHKTKEGYFFNGSIETDSECLQCSATFTEDQVNRYITK